MDIQIVKLQRIPQQTLCGLGLFLFMHCSIASQPYLDQQDIKNISNNWQCKWCPYDKKSTQKSEINAGGHVTNDSYKHGDYTGLNEKGGYAIADINYQRQSSDGNSFDIEANNLGLDSRKIEADVTLGGASNMSVLYDELPKLNSDTARTPYTGDVVQTLPTSWVNGSTTINMTELNNSLQYIDIMTQRKKLALSASYSQTQTLSYQVDFQRETKQGNKTAGLALGSSFAAARSAILAIPVDYVTNQGGIQLNYNKSRWHASVGYQFSKFENENNYTRWENAFSQPTGVNTGQAAQESSNSMQQVFIFGSYLFGNTTNSTAKISVGRLEQNDTFLPYTVNTSLSPAALPKTSLNGKINTFNGVFSIVSNINTQWRLHARYLQNEQDNNTARATYDYVIADTSLSSTSRANFPYSFQQRKLSADADYKFLPQHKVLFGTDYETINRTYQEVETTDENSIWAKYTFSRKNKVDFSFQITQQDREGSAYQAVTEITPPENPLLRKYNLADRERSKLSSIISYSPVNTMNMSFHVNYANDEYSNSEIGLTDSEQTDYTISYQYDLLTTTTFNIDYSNTDISSRQTSSQSFSTPTWFANNDEKIDMINFGVRRQIYRNKLDVGFNYGYLKSHGDITVSTADAFTTLKAVLHSISVDSEYQLNQHSSVTVFFRYEKYDEDNWAVDNVSQNTLNNVLTLGEVSPSYDIGVIAATYKYKF